ncbi:MAG: SPOR domain-containing protein [Gammaproteobacteria bacterium]|nr:MAG: SPOR domain-containing protein [Gammaproteobacteria bacterium]
MRWAFLFVFSLNLIYIGWEMSRSSTDDYADVPALKNVQTIVLLSELKQQQADLAKIEQVEDKTGDKAEAAIVDNTSTGGSPVKQAGSEQLAVKSQEIVEKKPEGTSEVTTQSDVINGAAETVASSKQAVPAEVLQANPSQSASCFTLGPFRDLDRLRSLTREIKSYVIKADFRGREEKEQTLYWVYIKPEKNHKKAIETGRRLKAKKIKDFYVIRDGEKIHGLSLGHFRNKDGAYGLAKKARNLGFNVIVEPVFRTYTIYWLDYQLASGVNIPEAIFEKHIKPGKKDKINRLSRDCGA